jgi:nicotinate-nucleotide adenylyltransferase
MRNHIGLFGGTFDPPHVAHLVLASEARVQLGLDRVLWVLTPTPPHKLDQTITALEHRLAMVQLATANDDDFELSRVEIDRPGPHYTIDTIRLLKKQNPGADFSLIIGGDSLRDILSWRLPRDIVAECRSIGVIPRPGARVNVSELEGQIPGISSKVREVNVMQIDIASRELRKRIKDGQAYRYYFPKEVYDYIEEHQLYR